jgi:hypothetical protein
MDLPETGTTQEGKEKVGFMSALSLQDSVNFCICSVSYSYSGDVGNAASSCWMTLVLEDSLADVVLVDNDKANRHRLVNGWFDLACIWGKEERAARCR